jgi:hypothetical protein
MNTQPNSNTEGIRSKLALLEAIELAALGLFVTFLTALASIGDPDVGLGNIFSAMLIFEGAIFLMWGSYNLFIRLSRAGGRAVDVGIWVIAAMATASITFWGWTALDINRFIISKLFYRGEAPVEYAWSSRSKQNRKEWEKMRKQASFAQTAA